MRLSPFPARADRPWRGVGLLAWHGIRENLRSLWFWLSLLVLPVIFLGGGLLSARDGVEQARRRHEEGSVEGHLAVVIPDPDLRRRAEEAEAGGTVDVLAAPPAADAPFAAVLVLDGADVRAVAPRLEVRDPEARSWTTSWAESVWTRVRADALLPEAERAQAGLVADEEEDTDEGATGPAVGPAEVSGFAAMIAPMIVGMIVLFGALSGFGAGSTLGQRRDQGMFAVLRVGTPAAVLFLGGLLEVGVLGVLRFVPYFALLVPAALGAAVLLGGRAVLGWTAGLVVVAGLGSALAYLAAAGVGVTLDALARGGPKPLKAIGSFLPIALMPLVFGLSDLPDGTAFSAIAPFAAVPLLGLPVLAKGVVLGEGLGWGALGGGLAAVLALVSVRVGSWAYAQEELRWIDVRRALSGGAR